MSVLALILAACAGSSSGTESPTASATAAPTQSAAAEPDDDDPAPRPLETKGKCGDTEYKPVVALGTATFKRDGHTHLVLEFFESERTCGAKGEAKKGDRQLMMSIPWETGAKLDLSAPPPDMAFNPNKLKAWSGKHWEEISDWRAPFGSVTVFEAPTKSGDKGRVRLKLRAGAVRLKGDLPVLLCVDAR
jgi:hypothetical protein